MSQRASLDSLGLKFGTDKASNGHDYLRFYEQFFEKHRETPLTVLEIGVLHGASLKVWEAYFPNGAIIGADINPAVRAFSGPRVSTEIIDQGNVEDLVRLGVKFGPFDIIVEDGSHFWEHQITSLRTLFPFVVAGGTYIVEDLQTNFGNMASRYRKESSISCVDYLKKLVDLRVADNQIDISKEDDPFLRTYGRNVEFMTFYKRACLLRKGHNSHYIQGFATDEPIIPSGTGRAEEIVRIVAHIGGQSDRKTDSGFIVSNNRGQNIQGFTLHSSEHFGRNLLYRARLDDGTWTEWVAPGNYVGTRNKSRDLTGFAVRFDDSKEPACGLTAAGLFRGLDEPVVVSDLSDCSPETGANALYGMQIVLQPSAASGRDDE